jgi:hypothetical protein
MLKTMQKELDIYQAKVRFIEEFISGEINILQKEDDEIENMLLERNYPKFGNSEEDDDSYSYEYLLNMKIKSLTKKKIDELKKLYESKLALFNDLQSKSDKDLWKEDLCKFLEVYKSKINEYNSKMAEQLKSLNGQKSSTKKAVGKKAGK